MFEKKKMIVNSDVCDARKMKEETLSGYEQIVLNADILLVDEHSKEILNRLPVISNVDTTVELEGEATPVICNGNYQITGDTAVMERTLLVINGSLTIAPKTEEILQKYIKIVVNGNVSCPKSLLPCLTMLIANGSIQAYPDHCVVMKPVLRVDKYFPIRAREGKSYYAADKILLVDTNADLTKLNAKGVDFVTEKLVVKEELLEEGIGMFAEDVELQVIPEGYAYVDGDQVLNNALMEKYGNKLYIDGNLRMEEESTPFITQLQGLCVVGDVELLKGQEEDFRRINAQYRELRITKGKQISNKLKMVVDSALLKASESGIIIKNCAALKILPEVESKEILDKLEIVNCAKVSCSLKQRSAVELVSRNIAQISDGKEESQDEPQSDSMNPLDLMKQFANCKIVNADSYVL